MARRQKKEARMNAASGHAPLRTVSWPRVSDSLLSPLQKVLFVFLLNRRQRVCASFFSVLSRANIYAAPLPWRLVLCLTPGPFTQIAAAAAEQETAGRFFLFFFVFYDG